MFRKRLKKLENDSKPYLKKVSQNAPNGVRACLDFQTFQGEDAPGLPYKDGPPAHQHTPPALMPHTAKFVPAGLLLQTKQSLSKMSHHLFQTETKLYIVLSITRAKY